jgi:TonB family protein
MFHYRLAPTDNRFRMLLAILLALAVHMGLLNIEYEPVPVSIPSVSLPRSVSILLKQNSPVKTPEVLTEKTDTAELAVEKKLSAVIKQEKPVPQKIVPVKEKTDIPVPQPALKKKAIEKPIVEEIAPLPLQPENSAKNLKSEPVETAKVQETVTGIEFPAVPQDNGASLPGTLQMAYPRYQLNDPPTYPGLARKRSQQGTVILEVLVTKEGRVDDLKIVTSSNFKLLDRAALSAVRKWSFEPGRRGEEKIPMWVRVPVTFQLRN